MTESGGSMTEEKQLCSFCLKQILELPEVEEPPRQKTMKRCQCGGSYIHSINARERLLHAAKLFDQIAATLYPVWARRAEHFAPGTDWWCVVAGDYHCAKADANMYRMMAKDPRVQDDCAFKKKPDFWSYGKER